MKIAIRNFGPIASFEFDLGDDFVLIVGENNIGKSYAISLVYLVIKTFVASRRALFYSRHFNYSYSDEDEVFVDAPIVNSEWLRKLEQDVAGGGLGTEFDVTRHVSQDIKALWERSLLPELREGLFGTFNEVANLQNRFTSDLLELEIITDHMCVIIGTEEDRLVVKAIKLSKAYKVRRVKAVRTVKEIGKIVWIYFPDEKPQQFERNYQLAFYKLFTRPLREAANLISDLHYLPASRSGLYQALSAFSQIVAELAKSRTLLSSRLVLPAISVPLSDYFLKLSNIRPLQKSDGVNPFNEIATRIEQEVLRGNVDFDVKTKRLLFAPVGTELALDLSATSSMVSEISPIAAYFKYVLPRAEIAARRGGKERDRDKRPKQIVIIEEPEAHLHPQLQAAIVTVFAEMARTAGVKVIMTSHSNYVFNKISNLVIEGAIDQKTFRGVLFKRLATGGVATDMKVSDLGIEDINFVEIGEDLYEERLRLINKKEEQANVRRDSSA